ncbi:MAG: superoxide dismutase [Firmicutes bacterium]|nr:superoxide dismutase [Bacillota bacterium]
MSYPFKLQPLPYAHDALEPYIDTATMQIHHGKHVQAYTDNLNKALESHTNLHKMSIDELLLGLDKLPTDIQVAVRNNAGGVYNHNLYFKVLKKDTELKDGVLKSAIVSKWGSVEKFLEAFKQAGLTQFGSGWASLVKTPKGDLEIVKTPNQDTALAIGKVILNVDVWEHSYYLKYQNRRAEYLDNFFKVINWDIVQELYNS